MQQTTQTFSQTEAIYMYSTYKYKYTYMFIIHGRNRAIHGYIVLAEADYVL